MELIASNDNYYGYPKDKMWYAVEFSLNNPTASPYSIDLFNGYNQTPIPSTTPLYNTPVLLSSTVNIGVAANQQGAYCDANDCLYVTNDSGGFNRVDVIDCSTNTIIKTFNALEITSIPRQIVYNPVNNQMYVSSSLSIFRIDCSNNTVFGTTISAGGESMAYNSLNNTIYVGASTGISIINCVTNLVTGSISIPVGFSFFSTNNCLCYNALLNRIYALCINGAVSESIFVIECQSNAVINTILLGLVVGGVGSNGMILYNSNNNFIYACNGGIDTYIVNCTTNLIASTFTFSSSDYQSGLALNLFNNVVYGYSADYGGLYYINGVDNSINSITPAIGIGDFISFGFYNTNNNSMYITHSVSQYIEILRNDSNFYITGTTNYNQFVTELQNVPKRVRHIRLTVESYSQMAVPFYLLKRDANGNFCGVPRIPTEELRPEDYQSFMCEMAFKPKELILNNNEIISGYTVAPESTVKMVLYFDEIDMSDLLSEKLNVYNQIETKVEDLNTISEATLERRYETRLSVKPSWLKNFKSGKAIKI